MVPRGEAETADEPKPQPGRRTSRRLRCCRLDPELMVVPQLGGGASAGLFAGALRAMPDFGLTLLGSHRAADRLGRRLRLLTAIVVEPAHSAVLLLAYWRRAASRVAALHQLRAGSPVRGHDDPGAVCN